MSTFLPYRRRSGIVNAQQFTWKDGEGIPDISGVRYGEWSMVDVGGGDMKNAPNIKTAYVQTLDGPVSIERGDWLVMEGGEMRPYKPSMFERTFEPG